MKSYEDQLVEQFIKGEINQYEFNGLMKMKNLQPGVRILAYGGHGTNQPNKGTIRKVRDEHCIAVEFDENIGGHDFYDEYGLSGKDGHCWFANESDIVEILNDDTSTTSSVV